MKILGPIAKKELSNFRLRPVVVLLWVAGRIKQCIQSTSKVIMVKWKMIKSIRVVKRLIKSVLVLLCDLCERVQSLTALLKLKYAALHRPTSSETKKEFILDTDGDTGTFFKCGVFPFNKFRNSWCIGLVYAIMQVHVLVNVLTKLWFNTSKLKQWALPAKQWALV